MFTKGKWEVEEDNMEELTVFTNEDEDFREEIATVRNLGNYDGREMMVNAQLISASPNLYETLEEIASLKPANFYNSRLATNLANMALAKVKEGKNDNKCKSSH